MTTRQAKAVQVMVAKGGSTSQALREAGYSEAIARNPQKVTKSQGWQEAMITYGLTPAKLFKKLNEGLEASKVEVIDVVTKDGKERREATKAPDHAIRHKYLDTALKVAGAYQNSEGGSLHFHQHIATNRDSYQL